MPVEIEPIDRLFLITELLEEGVTPYQIRAAADDACREWRFRAKKPHGCLTRPFESSAPAAGGTPDKEPNHSGLAPTNQTIPPEVHHS